MALDVHEGLLADPPELLPIRYGSGVAADGIQWW